MKTLLAVTRSERGLEAHIGDKSIPCQRIKKISREVNLRSNIYKALEKYGQPHAILEQLVAEPQLQDPIVWLVGIVAEEMLLSDGDRELIVSNSDYAWVAYSMILQVIQEGRIPSISDIEQEIINHNQERVPSYAQSLI